MKRQAAAYMNFNVKIFYCNCYSCFHVLLLCSISEGLHLSVLSLIIINRTMINLQIVMIKTLSARGIDPIQLDGFRSTHLIFFHLHT